jgi:hypothetical protein
MLIIILKILAGIVLFSIVSAFLAVITVRRLNKGAWKGTYSGFEDQLY